MQKEAAWRGTHRIRYTLDIGSKTDVRITLLKLIMHMYETVKE